MLHLPYTVSLDHITINASRFFMQTHFAEARSSSGDAQSRSECLVELDASEDAISLHSLLQHCAR
jgi:hypothetical protein